MNKNNYNPISVEADEEIKIVHYSSIEDLLAVIYKTSFENLHKIKYNGYNGDGNEWKLNFDDYIKAIKKLKCYGFASRKREIHIWVDGAIEINNLIRMLAHERAHLLRPYHKNQSQEEMKAESYALCASFSYDLADKIIGK